MSWIHAWVKAHQPVPFVDFMQQALYAPDGGYYANAPHIGRQGDFITAPELTPLFGQALAQQCAQILSELKSGNILEFGAGSGRLCVDVLTALEALDCLPEHYFILEVSAGLKARQKQMIEQHIAHLADRVCWLRAWPQSFTGVMLANEVLDAMPVHRFCYHNDVFSESHIGLDETGCLAEHWLPFEQGALLNYLQTTIGVLKLPQPYVSEVNWLAKGWIEQVAACLEKGALIAFDYGFPRHEYYHADRQQGTIMCHHQHHSHPDFLSNPGGDDLTAHVDFTLIAESGFDAGLRVTGFTNQAAFLINNGLTNLLQAIEDDSARLRQNKAVMTLTHPAEMGELFKVIALTKDFDEPLTGFSLFDKRVSL